MQLIAIARCSHEKGGFIKPPQIKRRVIAKTLLIMKFTAILLLAACLQVSAKGYSQITLHESNASLEKVFQKIEKQSGYLFWYTNAMLKDARRVDISVDGATLQQVLDICFRSQPLTYSIIEKVIVIKHPDEPPVNTSAQASPPPVDIKGKVTDENGAPIL